VGGGRTTVLVALAAALLLIWPVVDEAARSWAASEDLHFGFLVPPVAGWLIWRRRRLLREAIAHSGGQSTPAGLLVVVVSLAAYLLAQRLWAKSPAAYAAGMLLWGVVLSLWGWRCARLLAFPIAFLAFGLGLRQTLLAPVAFALQELTAGGAALLAQGLGIPAIREGLVLTTLGSSGWVPFIVADACSGMNSLLALGTLAAVWLHLADGPWASRLFVLLCLGPLVIAANSVRVAAVLATATLAGEDVALGFFHGASSLVLFGLSLAGMVVAGWLSGCRPPRSLLAAER
jgi:exosortase